MQGNQQVKLEHINNLKNKIFRILTHKDIKVTMQEEVLVSLLSISNNKMSSNNHNMLLNPQQQHQIWEQLNRLITHRLNNNNNKHMMRIY